MDGQTKEQNRNSDIRDVEEHARLPARTVYEIVRRKVWSMGRPSNSLWWSGFAAGLSIIFAGFTGGLDAPGPRSWL
jgi:hypothetical protein